MTPEVAELAMDVFERYKDAGGRVDHIKVYDNPEEAAEVGDGGGHGEEGLLTD